jgi:hypothetical protein
MNGGVSCCCLPGRCGNFDGGHTRYWLCRRYSSGRKKRSVETTKGNGMMESIMEDKKKRNSMIETEDNLKK